MNKQIHLAESLVDRYIHDYLTHNRAARLVSQMLDELGIGLRPLIDHITVRTHDVERRAEEFLSVGFAEDVNLGIVEYDNWWA
ncbi:MAG: hypothetical protein HY22_04970, partial [[Candidatus Thermochlorobacteriaceae] bacterium GBChlB]